MLVTKMREKILITAVHIDKLASPWVVNWVMHIWEFSWRFAGTSFSSYKFVWRNRIITASTAQKMCASWMNLEVAKCSVDNSKTLIDAHRISLADIVFSDENTDGVFRPHSQTCRLVFTYIIESSSYKPNGKWYCVCAWSSGHATASAIFVQTATSS